MRSGSIEPPIRIIRKSRESARRKIPPNDFRDRFEVVPDNGDNVLELDALLAQLKNKLHQKSTGLTKVVDPTQGLFSSKRKKRSKRSTKETAPSQGKRRHTSNKEVVPTPMPTIRPFEWVENPIITILSHQTPTPVASNQMTPPSTTRDSRRGKGVIEHLTTKIEGMTLYRDMALERVDHYVENLPYMAHEKQVDAICEDVDPTIVVSRLLFPSKW